ncbi:DNA-binding protein [Pseudomonas sp. Pseu.R1]|uniref:DNA-binding protein n=1 Tax=Pseudomonas sp. Pseu.R1 TaxID=3379818 RepID=UPI003B936AAA
MARPGINKALVQQARDRLIARGIHPSIDMVRSELGNTGSKTTILRFLRDLDLEEPKPPYVQLDQELQVFISSLAQRLAADAQDAVATDRARLDREQEAYQRKRQADVARLEELQSIYERTDKERREGQNRERELNERLQQLEGERQRLNSAEQHQHRLLDERALQIASLEQKHREARDSLKHYREQQLEQRNAEVARYEDSIRSLQHELRALQNQSMVKQEQVAELYRELERLNAEQRHRVQELQTQSQELEDENRRLHAVQDALRAEQAQSAKLLLELSVMREKARGYLQDHRQDRRALRVQADQLTYLHQLLSAKTTNV